MTSTIFSMVFATTLALLVLTPAVVQSFVTEKEMTDNTIPDENEVTILSDKEAAEVKKAFAAAAASVAGFNPSELSGNGINGFQFTRASQQGDDKDATEKLITGFPCPYTTYTDINIVDYTKTFIYCVGAFVGSSYVEYLTRMQLTSINTNLADCQWRMTYCPSGYDQTLVTFQQSVTPTNKFIVCQEIATPQCFRMVAPTQNDIGQYFRRSTVIMPLTNLLNTYNTTYNYYLKDDFNLDLAWTTTGFRVCALNTWPYSTC